MAAASAVVILAVVVQVLTGRCYFVGLRMW